MNTLLVRWSAIALVIGLFTFLLVSCAVTGDGYGYDGRVGVGVGYYEPYGYYGPYGAYYGGWGPGYHVGPIHGNNYHPAPGGRSTPHAYKPPPGGHPPPSIPSRRRSGDVQTHPWKKN